MQALKINCLLKLLAFGLIFLFVNGEEYSSSEKQVRTARSPAYNGQWDISGKHTAMLCEVLKRGEDGGDEEHDKDTPLPEPDKDTYTKDGQCWKNQWIPCENNDEDDRLAKEGVLSKRRKPCGHFKMIEDSNGC